MRGIASALLDIKELKSYSKEKIAILAIWFVSLIGVRILLGFTLSNIWLGTVGAVAITFAAFYIVLKYTPFKKYSKAVNSTLCEWYHKKYVLYGLVASIAVMITLMFLIEFGYVYHANQITSLAQLEMRSGDNNLGADDQISHSIRTLLTKGLPWGDALSIMAASVDKSLGGYYMKLVSYILAENLEIMAFLFVVKKTRNKGLFR